MEEGYSEHDCVEINGELCKELNKRGIKAELVRLLNVKHYVVEVKINDKVIYVDSCPELNGLFNYILPDGFIGDEKDLILFYNL